MDTNDLAGNFFQGYKPAGAGAVTSVRSTFADCPVHGVHGALAGKRLNSAIHSERVPNPSLFDTEWAVSIRARQSQTEV
jgi:hypothetical protein